MSKLKKEILFKEKSERIFRPSEHPPFSILVVKSKTLLNTVTNPARALLDRE